MNIGIEGTKTVRGVGALVFRGDKILLGKRKGAHCAGTWAPPGGKIEEGQSIIDAVTDELKSETGLIAIDFRQAPICTNYMPELEEHHMSIFVEVDVEDGEPELLEPEKCEEWVWFDWDKLPESLFPPFKMLLETGYTPNSAT